MEESTSNIMKYSSDIFISEITKIIKLKENNIYSDEEYIIKKKDLITDLSSKEITQGINDFLSCLLVLKENNILTVEEINQIKTSLSQKKETVEPIYTPESKVLADNQKKELKKANGLVSRILTILLTLLFFLPWFTFKACNMTYDYNGYSTIAFQPSDDVSNFSDKMSEFGDKFSDKTGSKKSNTDKFNDFFIISLISVLIAVLLVSLILISFYYFKIKSVTILSAIISILFIAIIAILLFDKSQISSEAKGMVDISINYGLFLCFLISLVIVFSKKIESGLIIREDEPNSMLFKLNNFFNNKFIGLIGIGIMVIGIVLSLLIFNSSDAETNKEVGLNKQSNTQSELDKKEKELKLKEEELNKKEQSNIQSGVPGNYPEGSTRYLNSSDLAGMSKYSLKIMRNEIFARHGFIFKTDEMRNHFFNQSWYTPLYDNVEGLLSPIEKANINLIKSFE